MIRLGELGTVIAGAFGWILAILGVTFVAGGLSSAAVIGLSYLPILFIFLTYAPAMRGNSTPFMAATGTIFGNALLFAFGGGFILALIDVAIGGFYLWRVLSTR